MVSIIKCLLNWMFRLLYLVFFFGYLLKGSGFFLTCILFLFFFPGFFIARCLDLTVNPFNKDRELTEADRKTFNNYLFCLAGFIARGNGRIDEKQIQGITQFLNRITSNSIERGQYIDQFNIGKQENFNPKDVCENCRKLVNNNRMIKHRLIEFLISIIYADGVVTPEEYSRLFTVSSYLQVEKYVTERLLNQAKAIYEFKRFFEESESTQKRFEEATSNGDSYNRAYVPHNDIQNARQVLGVSENALFPDVKKAYLKLMKKYHPDKLASQGFSDDTIKFYTDKAQTIQQAYDLLKKHYDSKNK
jgi:DnaJ like chaperone protein